MPNAFQPHRRRRRPYINITSLIDVMFLLVIFFSVSSTFQEPYGVDITLPAAESASPQEAAPRLIHVDQKGQLYLGDERVTGQELRAALRRIVEQNPEAPIVLRADANAPFAPVLRVIDLARQAGGKNLIIPADLPSPES